MTGMKIIAERFIIDKFLFCRFIDIVIYSLSLDYILPDFICKLSLTIKWCDILRGNCSCNEGGIMFNWNVICKELLLVIEKKEKALKLSAYLEIVSLTQLRETETNTALIKHLITCNLIPSNITYLLKFHPLLCK